MKKTILPLLCSLAAVCLFCGCYITNPNASASEQSTSSETSVISSIESSSIESSSESSVASSSESSIASSSESSIESSSESSVESSIEESSYQESSSSSTESSIEDSSVEDSSSADSSMEDSSVEEEPLPLEYGDLATSGHVGSRAPGYGAQNVRVIQSEVVSEDSEQALKGTFNCIGANVYQGYMVWTWAEFRLTDCFGEAQNLKDSLFVYDVKTENCGIYSSVILVSPDGSRTSEVSYNISTPSKAEGDIIITSLNNGWLRVSIDLSTVYFGEPIAQNVSEILIMFSNENCDGAKDSVFYMDNAKIVNITSNDKTSDITVNNPDGYYSKSDLLKIKVVGNSFVSETTSNSAYYLQLFGNTLGANLSVSHLSIANGRIPDQYAQAFGTSGYMAKEHVDVLFIQDFYSGSDMLALGEFLTSLYNVSPNTELKIYAGENETTDGIRAAAYYGVDLVNWRNAIKTLKANYSFTATHLNANDGWHPNELSGFIGGLMMYMELYGECPDFEIVKELAQEVWSYIPGADDIGKEANLDNIYNVAKNFVLDD